jgi:type VI secretion system ImpM family protein
VSVGILGDVPRAALFGKLPAHGDFVRRGDPALVARLDEWLTSEVERFATTAGQDLDDLLAGLPTWCFNLPGDLTGALTASRDKVGRIYPLIAGADAPAGRAEQIAALLADAIDQNLDADETSGRLIAIAADMAAEDGPRDNNGWWRASEPGSPATTPDTMPTGSDFARLFEAEG